MIFIFDAMKYVQQNINVKCRLQFYVCVSALVACSLLWFYDSASDATEIYIEDGRVFDGEIVEKNENQITIIDKYGITIVLPVNLIADIKADEGDPNQNEIAPFDGVKSNLDDIKIDIDTRHLSQIKDADISLDDKYLAVAMDRIVVFSMKSGKPICDSSLFSDSIPSKVDFLSDGITLLALTSPNQFGDNSMMVINAKECKLVKSINKTRLTEYVLSRDKSILILIDYYLSQIDVWNTNSWVLKRSIMTNLDSTYSSNYEYGVNDNNSQLAVIRKTMSYSTDSEGVIVWDINTGSLLSSFTSKMLEEGYSYIDQLLCHNWKCVVFFDSNGSHVSFVSMKTGEELDELDMPDEISNSYSLDRLPIHTGGKYISIGKYLIDIESFTIAYTAHRVNSIGLETHTSSYQSPQITAISNDGEKAIIRYDDLMLLMLTDKNEITASVKLMNSESQEEADKLIYRFASSNHWLITISEYRLVVTDTANGNSLTLVYVRKANKWLIYDKHNRISFEECKGCLNEIIRWRKDNKLFGSESYLDGKYISHLWESTFQSDKIRE